MRRELNDFHILERIQGGGEDEGKFSIISYPCESIAQSDSLRVLRRGSKANKPCVFALATRDDGGGDAMSQETEVKSGMPPWGIVIEMRS